MVLTPGQREARNEQCGGLGVKQISMEKAGLPRMFRKLKSCMKGGRMGGYERMKKGHEVG